jgi:Glycosyl hydrolases family 2, TIM barrel domain/Glycosyl hydrolases family 2, sugar binding domain
LSALRRAQLRLDEHGSVALDGTWDFFPAAHELEDLAGLEPERIQVPGLWEAQGYLELDGTAWYRHRFDIDLLEGFWTLRFGAVMDIAEPYLNGQLLGLHESPFTPFELDVTPALVAGENTLAVKVIDPSLDDPEHIRLPHGKQGWANNHFPSRPSLYMTYGGIWQPVTLQRHGPLVVNDVFVSSDPDRLTLTLEIANRGGTEEQARVGVRTLGMVWEEEIALGPGASTILEARLGATVAERWHPDSPVLHQALVDIVLADRTVSHTRSVRYGLRTVTVEGEQILLNGEPYRMKSVLVQGFRADGLYAEGTREEIREEVLAAKELGFNTLRLHIKGFDPTYLDVCDELGMLLHCDLPVAEPIAHEELGDDTLLARRCVAAVEGQIRRDRNHPSIILWSAMNELCLDRLEARYTDRYERFARALAGAVEREDPTRPYIENDWVEPEPERVFCAPVLTAHWYGRLHADYLERLERQSAQAAGLGKPLYVTEYGDWGLPDMPSLAEPPFWDTRAVYARGLADTLWPGTVARFVNETQRYQGLSDRLQTEVFRRHDHLGGYCLTELTDVPHELNGILDLHRRPKPIAAAEVRRMNQTVLPMLRLRSLVVEAGGDVEAPVYVANDGPALRDVEVEARFGDSIGARSPEDLLAVDGSCLSGEQAAARFEESVSGVRASGVPAYRSVEIGATSVAAPEVPGSHDLMLLLRSEGRVIAENRYPMHVVARPRFPASVRLLGRPGVTGEAMAAMGVAVGGSGPLVVEEGGLDRGTGDRVAGLLAAGETVIVLAQGPEEAANYPLAVEIAAVETKWGSSVFHFTTDDGALESFPRQTVLVAEDSTIQAWSVVTSIDGRLFPERPVVIAYKPVPSAMTGTVVGCEGAGEGRLIFCQYRLSEQAASGDASAKALFADLIRWGTDPRAGLAKELSTNERGAPVTFYSLAERDAA